MSQLRSVTTILRFWTLAMLAYVLLEEERDRLQTLWQRPVTIGQARREIQRRHRRTVLNWRNTAVPLGRPTRLLV